MVQRHLRHVFADEQRVRNAAVGDLGFVVHIRARDAPGRSDAVLDVGLHAAHARLAEVLFLRRRRIQGHVQHRIAHAIVEPREPCGHVARRRDVDARFATNQTLGPELIVRTRRHCADRELPVQLGQRGRTES